MSAVISGLQPDPLLARASLLARLLLLVGLAMLPLAAATIGEVLITRGDDLKMAKVRAVELARLGAGQQDALLQEARTVLAVLARVPQVTSAEPGQCHELLQQMIGDHPRLLSLLVTDGKGQVTCNSITPHPQIDLGTRPFVQKLLSPGAQGYELSELSRSQASGKPVIFVGLPLRPPLGSDYPSGLLATALDLDWLASMSARLAQGDLPGLDAGSYSSPTGGSATEGSASVLDLRNGTVLAGSPGDPSVPGQVLPDHPALRAYRAAPGVAGKAEGVAADGVPFLYGYAPLPGTDGSAILVVSLCRNHVLAVANRRMYTALGIIGAALASAIACTTFFGWRVFGRPAQTIMGMISQLSGGDLGARVTLSSWEAPELRLLGQTLNTMASKVAHAQTQLAESEDRFRQLAGTDGLTGLPNRRLFDEAYAREWRRAARENHPLALLLLDVDRFKLFNDRYGHLAGDDCLRIVATTVSTAVGRPSDVAARFGGEEFAILLPSTDARGGAEVAERVRMSIAGLAIEHQDNEIGCPFVTISIGVTAVWPGSIEEGNHAGDTTSSSYASPGPLSPAMIGILAEADEALYAAKRAGRNCIRIATQAVQPRRLELTTELPG